MPVRLGDRIGVLSRRRYWPTVVCDTTSINLYSKAVCAAIGAPAPRATS